MREPSRDTSWRRRPRGAVRDDAMAMADGKIVGDVPKGQTISRTRCGGRSDCAEASPKAALVLRFDHAKEEAEGCARSYGLRDFRTKPSIARDEKVAGGPLEAQQDGHVLRIG